MYVHVSPQVKSMFMPIRRDYLSERRTPTDLVFILHMICEYGNPL
jgi:hypothetical protein